MDPSESGLKPHQRNSLPTSVLNPETRMFVAYSRQSLLFRSSSIDSIPTPSPAREGTGSLGVLADRVEIRLLRARRRGDVVRVVLAAEGVELEAVVQVAGESAGIAVVEQRLVARRALPGLEGVKAAGQVEVAERRKVGVRAIGPQPVVERGEDCGPNTAEVRMWCGFPVGLRAGVRWTPRRRWRGARPARPCRGSIVSRNALNSAK